ncbi:MAG: N-acetyltransferase [Actinomycetota bacterium]|nr:N-acetyltransferase [Actinomycetota bacterium]
MDRNFEVTLNEKAERFETTVGGLTAELRYRLEGNRLLLVHTGVPRPIEGRGVGSALVRAAVEEGVRRSSKIVPLCWFARGWLERHPEVAAGADVEW